MDFGDTASGDHKESDDFFIKGKYFLIVAVARACVFSKSRMPKAWSSLIFANVPFRGFIISSRVS